MITKKSNKMAIELCSDNGMSPRISFSHDLCISDIAPVEQQQKQQHFLRSKSLNGSIDFNFCVRKSFDQESSSADELFSDGKIRPTEIKKKSNTNTNTTSSSAVMKQMDSCLTPASNEGLRKDGFKEAKSSSTDHEAEEKQSNSKSFWRFKRSSSLTCRSGYGRSLCPLALLSRSSSTGSTPSVKRATSSSKDNNHKQQKQVNKSSPSPSSSLLSSSSSSSNSTSYQKPPILKKNHGPYGSGGNGVRVSPVLNVPSGNLFGLASILFNGKDKNRKK